MVEFYKKAIAVFFGLIVLTSLIAYICMDRFFVSDPLLPFSRSTFPWQVDLIDDTFRGGSSVISVNDAVLGLDFNYTIRKDVTYPAVNLVLLFSNPENSSYWVDMSTYSKASFKVKCSHHNLLSFDLVSFDPNITDPNDFFSYRPATSLFSCDDEWNEVQVDLRHMWVPLWWLEQHNADLSSQDYWLDKVGAFTFGASRQGPVNTPANVKVIDLTLNGQDWRYVYYFFALFAIIWSGYLYWLLKTYTAALIANAKDKLLKDRPLIAYQQLSVEPHRDKEKNQVLRFMATRYPNPELSLEMAVATLGISRTRLNEILKAELGFTFSSYLNRLRLSEAARLLSERGEANVAEIAYSVGYNNVSYFNKLFKNEYGCTPKAFKEIYQKEDKN